MSIKVVRGKQLGVEKPSKKNLLVIVTSLQKIRLPAQLTTVLL
jgi:hypothetical protein